MVNQILCQRMFLGKEIQFPFHQSCCHTNAMAKLLEVLTADSSCIGQMHAFFEQSFVKGEDAWHSKMQTGIDEVVGWVKMIFSVTSGFTNCPSSFSTKLALG